ncbi:hypothetical protein GCM10011349_00710 [Novosphingobium indicum]|uniref:VanZ-like domain-containing protein n=1 Tax=Novosphingobium indicum TaxID=462949 RepID=A0ABQ2J825_9SPHN|nr:hypothetical protein GCM10011349_00710 [Novosphingobium indicum]
MDIFQHYEQTIEWIVSQCPGPDKFAHMSAGLTLWLLAALSTRRPLSSFFTLFPVVIFELANETMDRMAHGTWNWPDTIRDMAATWFWPFLLCLYLRVLPALSRRGENRRDPNLAPPFENHVDGTGAAVPPVGSANGDDVGGVLAGGKPV